MFQPNADQPSLSFVRHQAFTSSKFLYQQCLWVLEFHVWKQKDLTKLKCKQMNFNFTFFLSFFNSIFLFVFFRAWATVSIDDKCLSGVYSSNEHSFNILLFQVGYFIDWLIDRLNFFFYFVFFFQMNSFVLKIFILYLFCYLKCFSFFLYLI